MDQRRTGQQHAGLRPADTRRAAPEGDTVMAQFANQSNLTKFVNIILDGSTLAIHFLGDCDHLTGNVRVKMGAPTEIWIFLWTIQIPTLPPALVPIQPAALSALTWPLPDGQPSYVISAGTNGVLPEGQANPQWILVDNFLDSDEAGTISYHLEISYNNQVFKFDPTIVNVDPPP
jgi:hypothetical protein